MGITAWVLYYDTATSTHKFAELTGTAGYDSIESADWGLDKRDVVILVLQKGQHMNAWVNGRKQVAV